MRPAFAYRIEADGSKTYLCLEHLPGGEDPHDGNKDKSARAIKEQCARPECEQTRTFTAWETATLMKRAKPWFVFNLYSYAKSQDAATSRVTL